MWSIFFLHLLNLLTCLDSGTVSMDQFLEWHHLPRCWIVEKVFQSYHQFQLTCNQLQETIQYHDFLYLCKCLFCKISSSSLISSSPILAMWSAVKKFLHFSTPIQLVVYFQQHKVSLLLLNYHPFCFRYFNSLTNLDEDVLPFERYIHNLTLYYFLFLLILLLSISRALCQVSDTFSKQGCVMTGKHLRRLILWCASICSACSSVGIHF